LSDGGGGTPGQILSCIEIPLAPGARPRVARFPGARSRRRLAAERLREELLSLPEETRRRRLREARFHEPLLFDLLLAAGHEALPCDPRGAAEILDLATGLATLLDEKEGTASQIGCEEYSRAFCLTGAAWRLLGDFGQAEAAFEHAGHLPVSPAGRGFFCQSYGVLRWDQGRSEEAAALFHQAQRRYSEGQDVREEAVCLALLGMLHVDDGEPGHAAGLLREALQGLDPDGRPWLAAQCCLGLGFCHAFAGEADRARSAREEARRLYGGLWEEEELRSSWLEGRVAALAGDAEEAVELLDSVRRRLIGRRRLPEATLATIDLGMAWSGNGEGARVREPIEELKAAFVDHPGFQIAMGALETMADDAAAGRLDRDVWSCVSGPLRQAFRWQGVPVQPLPFV
jgi:tetratricopeptide (TPR) repeat protein